MTRMATGMSAQPDTDRETAHRAGWTVTVAGLEAAATGLFLMAAPGLFGSWVLGGDLSEAGQALGRLAGLTLFSFGFACRPEARATEKSVSMLRPMQLYNLLATVYLAYLGISGIAGILLWPAVGIHAVLSFLLAHTSYRGAVTRTD